MFDRLVCMNGGNPREDLIAHKDPALAIELEHSPEWEKLSQNHLEGRSAAFFCYGDGGGDELDESGRPQILRHPAWFDPAREPFDDMRDTYAPLVWQCRYSGIEVPDRSGGTWSSDGTRSTARTRRSTWRSEPDLLREFDDVDRCVRPPRRQEGQGEARTSIAPSATGHLPISGSISRPSGVASAWRWASRSRGLRPRSSRSGA